MENGIPKTSEFWGGFEYCFRHTCARLALQDKLIAELKEENQFLREVIGENHDKERDKKSD